MTLVYSPWRIRAVKRISCIALFLFAAIPGWSAAKKVTIAELESMLQTMHKDNKSDADVALALKQVVMSEQLTRPFMNSLAPDVPGQLTTEQLYVLEARSATLPAAAADLPSTPAPDGAAQQALLAKASAYAANYQQLPALTVVRTTLRFQDNVEVISESSGISGSAKDASTSPVNPSHYVHYINSTDTTIGLEHGVERLPQDKTRWGTNRMVQIMEPSPGLTQVFHEATDAASVKWARWETVNGKPAAVFSFQVPKKKAHLAMNVCCFPEVDAAGKAVFTSAALGGAAGGGASGNFQTNTEWHPFKQGSVAYHGEFFIDPDTGVVLRMITEMEPKTSDVVHQQDTRTDYAPVDVGGKPLVLPVKSWVITEVVPNGDSGAGGFSTRSTLFSSDYKNYQLSH
jgi:hypothetical protein